MNRVRYILRGITFLLIILLLINLNRKTEAVERVVKFKLETLKKIKTDSLDTKQKLDAFIDETSRFNNEITEDFPYLKKNIRFLTGAVLLLIVVELAFFVKKKRNTRQ
jgi:hypothetical protein